MNFSIQSAKTVDGAVEKALKELNVSRDKVDIEIIEEPSAGFLGLIGGKDAIVKVTKKLDSREIVDSILKDEEILSVQDDLNRSDATERDIPIEREKAEAAGEEEAIEVEPSANRLDSDAEKPEAVFLSDEELESLIREFIDRLMDALGLAYTLSVEFQGKEIRISIDGKQDETGIVIGKRGSTLNGIQTVLSAVINGRSDGFRRVIVDCSGYRKKREQVLKRIAGRTANKVLKTNKSIKLEPMNAQERRVIHACLANVDGIRTQSEGKDPRRCVVIHKDTSQPS